MGKDPDPRIHLQQWPWHYRNLNCASNVRPPDIGEQRNNSMVFPIYANPYGCSFSGNGTMNVPGLVPHKFHQMNSPLNPPLNPMNVPSGVVSSQKKYLVFDQSGDETNLIFSSVAPSFWNPNAANAKPFCDFGVDPVGNQDPNNQSDETDVSNGHGNEEMHEDTEEIDALLYSDSDEYYEEEEASTGHSPVEMITGSAEEVVDSSAIPAKRRRIENELDSSLVDTASSAGNFHRGSLPDHDKDIESSCVKGERGSPMTPNYSSKRLKRERIQETVRTLRRIIPGGKGKDATVVLDEAIWYLRSLKLKAKALGATL